MSSDPDNSTTTLAKAVAANDENEVLRLLESDPSQLDQVDGFGNTLLNSACAIGANSGMIIGLISAGCDVSLPNKRGIVPLFSAVYANSDPVVFKELVKNGAKINHQNDAGGTALQVACIVKLPYASVKTLVELGADVDLTNKHGYTPLHLACRNLMGPETVRLLASKTKNINAKVFDDDNKFPGYTALHFALQQHNPHAAAELLKFKASQTITNAQGETPIALADSTLRTALLSEDPINALTRLEAKPVSEDKKRNAGNANGRKSIWKAMNQENPIFSLASGVVGRSSTYNKQIKKSAATTSTPIPEATTSTTIPTSSSTTTTTTTPTPTTTTTTTTKKTTKPSTKNPNTDEATLDAENVARLDRDRKRREQKMNSNSNQPPVKFPFHPTVPTKNVFEGRAMAEPNRFINILENHLMTAQSISRAFAAKPIPGDVWVVAAPCCGQQIVQRMVRFLQSDRPSDVVADRKGCAPWIESRYMDADPSWLTKPQGSTKGRVFQTAMTVNVCRINKVDPEVKYVVVVRDPIDAKYDFVNYLKKCYALPTDLELKPWDSLFDLDDFANVSVSICDAGGGQKTYERFICEWVLEAQERPKQILLILYESLITNPRRELKRLARFLDVGLYDELTNMILKDAAMDGLGSADVGNSASASGTGVRKALRRMTNLGAGAGGGGGAGATGKEGPAEQLTGGMGVRMFSDKAQVSMKAKWVVVSEKVRRSETYQDFYENLYDEDYPFKKVAKVVVDCFGRQKIVMLDPEFIPYDQKEKALKEKLEQAEKEIVRKAEGYDREAPSAVSVSLKN
jgi:ankyrin repeat protein